MILKRGSKRIALIIGSLLVIKVPRMGFVFLKCRESVGFMAQGEFGLAWTMVAGFAWRHLTDAIRQNWSEYRTWRKLRASFLVPTYFSLGFFNVQAYGEGDQPTMSQMEEVWQHLSGRARTDAFNVDPHSLGWVNIRRSHRGYRFIDYGDSSHGLLLSEWLERYQGAVEAILTAPFP